VGIGAPHESSYKVPVRVKYGRTACRIPKSKWATFIFYILALYIYHDFQTDSVYSVYSEIFRLNQDRLISQNIFAL